MFVGGTEVFVKVHVGGTGVKVCVFVGGAHVMFTVFAGTQLAEVGVFVRPLDIVVDDKQTKKVITAKSVLGKRF